MSGQSPLKIKPLRLPGESAANEIDRWVNDKALGSLIPAACFCVVAYFEWYGYITHAPRRPYLFTALAVVAIVFAGLRIWHIRDRVRRLKLGRDGERVVGQLLEQLRETGAQVFHDVPGQGFNLDHVVLCTHGIYAIETKTRTKPSSRARIIVAGESLTMAGYEPDRTPIEQVSAAARWLEKTLQQSTGRRFFVRGVVVFPGWYVEQKGPRGDVWVLEPKALPAFIENAPAMISASDVTLAAFHLSQYVRNAAERAA
jgi:Nuclease-related domain